jgi:hypothetical protein
VTDMKLAELMSPSGLLKCGVLVKLNSSARTEIQAFPYGGGAKDRQIQVSPARAAQDIPSAVS